MREIKFRASVSDNKGVHQRWAYGTPEFGDMGQLYIHEGIGGRFLCEQGTLGQLTGLPDKNGKEIYEGDVLLVFDEAVVPVTDEGQGPIEECNHIVPVEMREGVWGFEIPKTDDGETGWYGLHYWNTDISSESYEIIGNLHENPELISKK